MNTLTDYYKTTGGSLGKTVAERFADPNFAKAATMAGFNASNYSINSGNAAANTAILNNLKVLQQSGGIQGGTGAVVTSGNQVSQDRSLMNNVNSWLNGQNTNNNTNPAGTGTQNPNQNQNQNQNNNQNNQNNQNQNNNQNGNNTNTNSNGNTDTVTSPFQSSIQSSIDAANKLGETQVNTLRTALDEARGRMNVANQELIDRIHSNFDQARKTQVDVNSRIQAGTEKFGILTGRSRYTPETQQGIEAQEMQAGIDRITKLNVEEADLIAKAEAARAEEDFDMLYKTWNMYNDVRKETNNTVAELYKQSVTAQKNAQDAQIEMLKAQKQSITDQIKLIESVAPSIAENLARLPENLKATYLEKVAAQYGVDVNQIKGAVIGYQNERADKKKAANSGGGTASERQAYKETQAYSDADSLMAEDNFAFQVEGKAEPVQLKDDNGYITPQGFRLLNSRILRPSGISREDFIKQYPEVFYTKGTEFDNYGLTDNEKKILIGKE